MIANQKYERTQTHAHTPSNTFHSTNSLFSLPLLSLARCHFVYILICFSFHIKIVMPSSVSSQGIPLHANDKELNMLCCCRFFASLLSIRSCDNTRTRTDTDTCKTFTSFRFRCGREFDAIQTNPLTSHMHTNNTVPLARQHFISIYLTSLFAEVVLNDRSTWLCPSIILFSSVEIIFFLSFLHFTRVHLWMWSFEICSILIRS